MFERQLERWVPEEGEARAFQLDNSRESANWDQFAVNEKLFGIKTDYDEHLYTTKLDKDSAEYKMREKEAERLAKQIEKVFMTFYPVFNLLGGCR